MIGGGGGAVGLLYPLKSARLAIWWAISAVLGLFLSRHCSSWLHCLKTSSCFDWSSRVTKDFNMAFVSFMLVSRKFKNLSFLGMPPLLPLLSRMESLLSLVELLSALFEIELPLVELDFKCKSFLSCAQAWAWLCLHSTSWSFWQDRSIVLVRLAVAYVQNCKLWI
jgi:hypothetical protein